MTYPKVSTSETGVPASPKFPAIEERVLAYWHADGTFQASIDQRDPGADGGNEFVFYDGPPFANGLPHYGHLLTGYVKDIVPRYQTMRGKRVERRFGWDTHGLPAELEAMRLNGIKTTDEIVEMGIDRFNEACRESVMKYTGEWRDYVTRQARWVDFDHDYRTMNPEYMESVIWAFKSLHDKGLVYEGFRVLPYCWNDETPLSNHELRMDDDVYQNRQDPAVTVGYDITTEGELKGAKLLVWTTTPWTLPSNLAVMVGSEIDYVAVEADGVRYVLAEARLASYARELGESPDVVWRGKGTDLLGLTYTPPFAYYLGHERAFRVVAADDAVTTTDGTGLVHTAGAFGEVDKEVTDREGIEPVMPVGKDGRFTHPVEEYAGMQVFDANLHILDHLKAATRGEQGEAIGSVTPGTVLLRRETYDHSYPHCWRCREPLIYKGVSSWFVEVTAIKERMLELNQQIRWVPEHIKDGQFGKWLANARDWSITRNRFWGSPVPVWKSDDPAYPRIDVYGSFAELERDFGTLPRNKDGEPDLHRPYVDQLVRPNPDDPRSPEEGQSMMRRVTDVLDVWFDSGSMSFAQNHYPFENADWFDGTAEKKGHFPGDFIVEYIGQTRGWFYTLHVLATALFDKPAFQSCISHGIVLGSDGNKMSKSLRNYPDVSEVFDRDGADAMRWFLMSSPILRGGNLVVTEQGIRDSVRQVMIPLWNSWYFFQLYANAANDGQGYDARWSTDSQDPLDRYLLAKLRQYVATMTTQLDEYAVADACETTRSFLDVLTNWYIRRSRDRFWGDSTEAFDTLYTVLEVVCRTIAPLLPLTTEEVWRGLTGERSVHLADWPDVEALPADDALVAAMDQVREVCSATSALRKAGSLRNRLPLSTLTVVVDDPAALGGFEGIVADEVNVKRVRLLAADSEEAASYGVEQKLTVNARAAGPRLGKDVQRAIKGSKSGDWSVAEDGTVVSGGLALQEGEYTLETVAGSADASSATGVLRSGGFVVLDTEVTPELAAEGLARDLVRQVQQARRDAGLEVSDRIALTVAGPADVLAAAQTHRDLLTSETLATSLDLAPSDSADPQVTVAKA
ncbi:isoleucine--tRNA ligase [Nocardioides sp. zg-579]|uniref:Isoleucine--tRNA ligase n=1 Tax=Nocardioides marmotae TaxID=2663857 RepID=A0A6I3IYW8_9ACTN|nr:isoleucine--tRNA ligase [Nocardioides marmotae]MCR6030631.1 isoleucine--tRNA ligase [Gordonia jinghuaiqii]MTB94267.1 isoleucine--tRNA ligase [Nocardioides marmotae]QKE00544.1 isoleucine--tRNA ligase [Nocardioides marmotae]